MQYKKRFYDIMFYDDEDIAHRIIKLKNKKPEFKSKPLIEAIKDMWDTAYWKIKNGQF